MATETERREWATKSRFVEVVGGLFEREDESEGDRRVFNGRDRKTLRVALRIAWESNVAFRELLRLGGAIDRTERIDSWCDSILGGLECLAAVKQTASIVKAVKVPRVKGGRLRQLLVEHERLFRQIQRRSLGLSPRLSIMVELIQIELIAFGQLW